jgi:hypothetical protein
MDLVNRLSPIAVEKKIDILNILHGVSIKDAELALEAALYSVATCLDEQKKTTICYDNKIVNDYFARGRL